MTGDGPAAGKGKLSLIVRSHYAPSPPAATGGKGAAAVASIPTGRSRWAWEESKVARRSAWLREPCL